MRTQSLFSGGIQNRYEPGHSGGKISKRASNSYGWLRFSKTYILHRKTIRELNGDDAINRFTPGFFSIKTAATDCGYLSFIALPPFLWISNFPEMLLALIRSYIFIHFRVRNEPIIWYAYFSFFRVSPSSVYHLW